MSGMGLDDERARETLDKLIALDWAQRREAMAKRVRGMPAGRLRERIELEMERFAERLADYLALEDGLLPASQEVALLEALGESSLRLAGLFDRWSLMGEDEEELAREFSQVIGEVAAMFAGDRGAARGGLVN